MSPPMVVEPQTDADILSTCEVMRQLRPEIAASDYLPIVRRLMTREGYRLAAVVEERRVRAVAGYRFMEMLYCGRILYVDDLVTDEEARSRGFGRQLVVWLKNRARQESCREVHLDSRRHRADAHRFYEREGFTKTCYHLVAPV